MNTDEVLAKLPEGIFTLRDRVAQVMKIVDADLVAALERELKLQQDLDDMNVKFGGPTPVPNPTTRTFTRKYLVDELDLPNDDSIVKTWIIEEQDHLTVRGLIFRDMDQLGEYAWQTTFTTSNDDDEAEPWENETEIECTLVRLGTKTVRAWIPAVMPENSGA